MNTVNEQLALPITPPATWLKPKGKNGCNRDPEAGPGTCWHWWDGCSNAKKRGGYLLYARELRGQTTKEQANG